MFKKTSHWFDVHRLEIAITLLLSALLFLSALPMMLVSIDSGHKGFYGDVFLAVQNSNAALEKALHSSFHGTG